MPGSLFNTFNFETVQSSNFYLCVVASDDLKITAYDTLDPVASVIKNWRFRVLEVPKDISTLIKTPNIHDIVDIIFDGSYIHLGLRDMLLLVLIKNNELIYIKSRMLEICLI